MSIYKNFELNTGDNPVILVGDVHGDLNVFIEPFKKFLALRDAGKNPYLIYLGDYIDRGEYGFYICSLIQMIQNNSRFRENVYFVIGNHDDEPFRSNMYEIEYMFDCDPDFRSIIVHERDGLCCHSFTQSIDSDLICGKAYHHILLNNKYILSHVPLAQYIDSLDFDGKRIYPFEYMNIHAHDHKGDNKNEVMICGDIRRARPNTTVSLDFDMSYGFPLLSNVYKKVNMETDFYDCASNIKYIIIDNQRVTMEKCFIKFNDIGRNYNLKKFKEICTEMSLGDIYRRRIDSDWFGRALSMIFSAENIGDELIEKFKNNPMELENYEIMHFQDPRRMATYDIPVEFWFGWNTEDDYPPCTTFYWSDIVGYKEESLKNLIKDLYNCEIDTRTLKITGPVSGSKPIYGKVGPSSVRTVGGSRSINLIGLLIAMIVIIVIISCIITFICCYITKMIKNKNYYRINV